MIRYFAPYYYVIYLHAAIPGHNGWVSFLARSKDLAAWELSPFNPILEAGPGEGINNSDVDLFEWEGKTYLYYATGDQATWGSVRGDVCRPDARVLRELFPEGAKMTEVNALFPGRRGWGRQRGDKRVGSEWHLNFRKLFDAKMI